jgi:hypothetical protein
MSNIQTVTSSVDAPAKENGFAVAVRTRHRLFLIAIGLPFETYGVGLDFRLKR